ncbi:MAG: succinate dehydrogenase, partial [Epsilonproteobacteria bacterium]|nr:succinate dehydrogenase [Campylobacterota bacterium]
VFYQNVGIIRKDAHMMSVLAMLRNLQRDFKTMGLGDKSKTHNSNLVEFIEFGNMLELGEIILVGAMNRKESREYILERIFQHLIPLLHCILFFWKEGMVFCVPIL